MNEQPRDQEVKPVEAFRQPRNRLSLNFSLWWIVVGLILAVVAMLALWRPWEGKLDESRTVTVSGSTVIKAEPDEYTFNPSYEFKNADKQTALKGATDKSVEVIAALKKLGVADKDITSNTGGWDGYYHYNSDDKLYNYTLGISVKASSREQAQKIQDYLVTTTPSGQISPNASFSQAKQKQLEQQGRSEASQEARAKADEMAKNLGFTVAKVKSIADTGRDGGNFLYPMNSIKDITGGAGSAEVSSLDVQPGQNELTYTVQVVYYIR